MHKMTRGWYSMSCFFNRDSRELLVLAVVLASALAQDQGQDEIGRMAAFFTVVGDTLALFALQPGLAQTCCELAFPECGPSDPSEDKAQES